MMKYNVTITRTGGIVVESKSVEGAISKVAEMSTAQIEERAQLTGWEPSDAEILEEGE